MNHAPPERETDRPPVRGISLVEVLTVVAVIAILAGLVVPMMTGRTDEAKIERAETETRSIGEALHVFVSSIGEWPARNSSGTKNSLAVLLSGTSIPSTNPWGAAHSFWTWASGSGGDVLDHHLMQNRPQGQATNTYPASGRHPWNGPYFDRATLDPWGRPYVVNVVSGYSSSASTNRRLWVLSAGPDGILQTSATAGLADDVGGDDVGFLVQQR